MSASSLLITFLLLSSTMPAMTQQPQLEEQIKQLLLNEEPVDLKTELRRLGNDDEIATLLMQLASDNRSAVVRSQRLIILDGAVSALGQIRATSANDLLSSLLTDQKVQRNVRAGAARSLGQIDPERNKEILLRALDQTSDFYLIRVYAAEGLAKTRDAKALKALERYGREEKDAYVRQKFENGAQAMRANGVKPN